MKSILSLLFTAFYLTISAQEIVEIKELYWKVENDKMIRTNFKHDIHHFKPFYEYFLVKGVDFYPSYNFDGNYEAVYKFYNGKIKECEIIPYSKKNTISDQKTTMKFGYDGDGNLSTIIDRTSVMKFERVYNGNLIKISDNQNFEAEISIENGLVYELKSGKIGDMVFYHYPDKVELIMPQSQTKLIYSYFNNKIIEVEMFSFGKSESIIDINYETDNYNNWTKKTIKTNNKILGIVTREIKYK